MEALNYSGVVSAGPGWTRVTTPSGQTVTVRGTRSTRNNNPGNIEYGSFARSYGAIGSDGRFAVFPSRQAGFSAVQGLVFGGRYSNLSLKDAIAKYAPPSENQSLAYAKAVAAKIGVSLNTKMKDIPADLRDAVAHAISGVEGLGRAVVSDLEGNVLGTIRPGRSAQPSGYPSLPDAMPLPPQRYQTVAASPVAPSTQSMQSAMRLASIGNAPYSAPRGRVERSALPDVPPARASSAYATTNLPSRPSPPVSTERTASIPRAALGIGSITPPSFSSARMTAPATTAPTQSFQRAPSPSIQPSNAYATTNLPSVAPKAPSLPAALTSPSLMGPAQTFSPQTPVQPTFVSMAQPVAPPVAPVAPPVTPPVAVPRQVPQVARNSFPAAPAPAPRATAMDVYNGAANQGFANDGSMVTRDQFGNVSITNKYGATTTTHPNGMVSASFGQAPQPASSFPSAPSIDGPLGAGGITTKQGGGLFGIKPAKTETGNLARGFTGAMAGSALGSLAGPIGSLIGAAIGKSIAQGKNPFDALSRNNGFTTYNTPAFGAIRAAAPVAGGAFPTAPTVRGALGGTQSNRSDSGMRSISPGAASAISRGVGGLY